MSYVLGLTGGIATGKSTAAAFFAKQGVSIIDADQVAHQLEEPGQSGWRAIKQAFGPTFFSADHQLNRHKLGRVVFAEPAKLAQLNTLLQPLIRDEIIRKIQQADGFCVLDAPLLFEQNYQTLCKRTLLIAADQDVQLQRLCQRNQLDEKSAQARIDSQMPLAKKRQLADDIIDNNGSQAELLAALTVYWQKLSKEVGAL
ncbi:MAG: dephospho-CoA kinase [Lactobacillus sp.]|jgi:dephospho-CoA kinase|nr:dephospho-CoA kinase [Lactobacillus sp.]MCH3990380.1 dephospho-CoA kinase [Lactobacillus sp.]MCH4068905.1 dephospho-CoA kinase [Lactobacillus sp.]MCI1303307.1 dephospho-CoA kinase [Lactobacillus sp.]MCI1329383.1 dephospho-CoA kinase [Lactobacillus sp.]